MEGRMKILLVEDDLALAEEIAQFLGRWGYCAQQARQFEDVMSDFIAICPHLVLMDVNLPYYDGFYWCRKIREASDLPILFISSRDDDRDKIMAIAQGGDDYVEKPFQLELLKAKIEAALRRAYQYKVTDRIYLGQDLYFEQGASELRLGGNALALTKSEKKIMAKLLDRKPMVVSREELMMELWSTDEFVLDGTLSTMICRLRNKLSAACGKELIGTKKGQGYYIRPCE